MTQQSLEINDLETLKNQNKIYNKNEYLRGLTTRFSGIFKNLASKNN